MLWLCRTGHHHVIFRIKNRYMQLWCVLINHTERIFHFYFIIIKERVINREWTDRSLTLTSASLVHIQTGRHMCRHYCRYAICERHPQPLTAALPAKRVHISSPLALIIRALHVTHAMFSHHRSHCTPFALACNSIWRSPVSHRAGDDGPLCGRAVWSGLPLWCPSAIMDMLFRMPY